VSETCIIAGLGNPGDQYRETRHNAGFLLLDLLVSRWKLSWSYDRKFLVETTEVRRDNRRLILVKPQTYMNRSGESIGPMSRYFHVRPFETFVVIDDVDLPLGSLRLRPQGSPGGHRGLESVERHLGSREYPRLKLGIARPSGGREMVGHVLGRFSDDEWALFQQVLDRAAQQIECWSSDGLAKAMSLYNGSVVTSTKS